MSNYQKGFSKTFLLILITAVLLFILLAGYFEIRYNRYSLGKSVINKYESITGKCFPGYVDYGIPLGCVSKEYADYCKAGNMCPR